MTQTTTQATHTPGPWRCEPYEGSHESAIIGKCYQIATVGYDDHEHSNARLIAAAPDLLEACERAIDICRDMGVYHGRYEFLSDAIKAAKGEQ